MLLLELQKDIEFQMWVMNTFQEIDDTCCITSFL